MCSWNYINMAHTQFVMQFFSLAEAGVVAIWNSRDFFHGLYIMPFLKKIHAW